MKLAKSMALIFALCTTTGSVVQAQEKLSAVTYNVSIPISDTKDFVDSASWRGFGVQGRWWRGENMSIGASFAWQVFNHETRDPILQDNATISGLQFRYINSFPFLLTGHYYLGKENAARPYAGLGVGTYYIEQRLELGLVAFTEDKWHFGLAPELGVLIPVGDYYGDSHLMINGIYNYAFDSGDVDAVSFWGVNVGMTWYPDY